MPFQFRRSERTFTLPGSNETFRFLWGAALGDRLAVLSGVANDNHSKATASWKGMLNYAREAGMALLEAQKRLGFAGKWGKWVKSRFNGSRETAIVYMRIAKHWNHPNVVQAKVRGMEPTSINTFLKLVRGQPQESKEPMKDPERDMRRSVVEQVKTALSWMTPTEVAVLESNFDEAWRAMKGSLANKPINPNGSRLRANDSDDDEELDWDRPAEDAAEAERTRFAAEHEERATRHRRASASRRHYGQ
jgi:hypothetical protein